MLLSYYGVYIVSTPMNIADYIVAGEIDRVAVPVDFKYRIE